MKVSDINLRDNEPRFASPWLCFAVLGLFSYSEGIWHTGAGTDLSAESRRKIGTASYVEKWLMKQLP